jgi:hypothetical protein
MQFEKYEQERLKAKLLGYFKEFLVAFLFGASGHGVIHIGRERIYPALKYLQIRKIISEKEFDEAMAHFRFHPDLHRTNHRLKNFLVEVKPLQNGKLDHEKSFNDLRCQDHGWRTTSFYKDRTIYVVFVEQSFNLLRNDHPVFYVLERINLPAFLKDQTSNLKPAVPFFRELGVVLDDDVVALAEFWTRNLVSVMDNIYKEAGRRYGRAGKRD